MEISNTKHIFKYQTLMNTFKYTALFDIMLRHVQTI